MTGTMRALEITPDTWAMIQAVAPACHLSRLLGVASPEQAIVVALTGHELGFGLMASFQFIAIVQGKPSLSPRGALALALNSGELTGLKIEELDDKNGKPYSCRVSLKRKNGMEYTTEFTMDDARKAGLVKPGGAWDTYPRNLLKWRSIGFALDTLLPDVSGGLKRSDDMGATVSEAGDVIEAEWSEVPSNTPANGVTTPPTLDDLVALYGPDAVLAASGGTIPMSNDDVARAAERLSQKNG